MFGLFQSKKEKLEKQYTKLLDEAYRLSHTDRQKSDRKQAEADALRREIDALEQPA